MQPNKVVEFLFLAAEEFQASLQSKTRSKHRIAIKQEVETNSREQQDSRLFVVVT
jgi:hypothetical protein